MSEIFDSKLIEDIDDYENPFITMDVEKPPTNWVMGEYPSIDDIWAWLHLSKICATQQNKTSKAPLVPEIVFVFRLERFSNICYKRQFLRSYGFFKLYGTTDMKPVVQEEWLCYLTVLIEADGLHDVVALFPPDVNPFKTKYHANPKIKKVIDLLRKNNGHDDADITINAPTPREHFDVPVKKPDIFLEKNAFQLSKTFDERLLTPEQIQKATGLTNSRKPANFDYQEISRATLPKEGEEEIMGSGVSCGVIGEGGMATVYKVRVEDLEIIRAGKVLIPAKVCQSEEQAQTLIARYKDEAKVTAQLHHTNVVVLHLFGKFRGLPYIEMEYVDGSDLKKLVERKGKMPLELFSAISILGLRGLAYAHSQCVTLYGKEHQGVMHRDIKPANILIDLKKGNVKLTDFGLARPPAVSVHTISNNIVGTLGYMSPEQLESRDVDTRTDIYSFGATMYETLAGVPLFPQDNIMDLMKARQANYYEPLKNTRGDLHKDILHIIDTCVKYNASDRLQSADTLMDHLEDFHHKVSKDRPESILQDYVLGKKYFELADNQHKSKRTFFEKLLRRY